MKQLITSRINPETGNVEIVRGNKVIAWGYEKPAIAKTKEGKFIAFSPYYEGMIPKREIGQLFYMEELPQVVIPGKLEWEILQKGE